MEKTSSILVAGAGAAGLTAGIALAKSGFNVTVAGALDTRRNGRTVALFEASLRLYRALGLWPRLEPISSPLEKIRLVDDTDSLFRPPPITLRSSEINLPAFGANIENAELVTALADVARETPGLQLIETLIEDYSFGPDKVVARLANGREIEAALLVGADGRNSKARAAAGIASRLRTYPQVAMTAILSLERSHRNMSTEFHTRVGPCTLVPLPASTEHRHRVSLVWLMSADDAQRRMALPDADLALEIEHQVHAIHGRVALEGPRGAFPMSSLRCDRLTAPRVALVADAGHFFPPIGAQGLNLGLRDVAQLVDSLETFGRADPGAPSALAAYDWARRPDVATRLTGVDLLNRSLLLDLAPMDFVRGAGLVAMSSIGPLRRLLMREGVAPPGRLPRLMRARRADLVETAP